MAELRGFGLTQPQIAHLCDCAQATLSDLANGRTTEPRHTLGESLKALAARCRAGDIPARAEPPANDSEKARA